MKLCVIPARGGSKRIPRKNIKLFYGKPMIAWSIEAAKSSNCFEHIVVSTEDEEIAEIAKEWGASVPFLRPKELADDYTTTREVIKHSLEECQKIFGEFEYLCCIYATAPFLQPDFLQKGFDNMLDQNASFCFSVAEFQSPIQRALKILPSGRVQMFDPLNRATRSQDLQPAYHDAAQFYWSRTSAIQNDIPTFSDDAVPVVLPKYLVQDIDDLDDWYRAELMFEVVKKLEKK